MDFLGLLVARQPVADGLECNTRLQRGAVHRREAGDPVEADSPPGALEGTLEDVEDFMGRVRMPAGAGTSRPSS